MSDQSSMRRLNNSMLGGEPLLLFWRNRAAAVNADTQQICFYNSSGAGCVLKKTCRIKVLRWAEHDINALGSDC